jgi:putative DNA primase/helicase
VDNCTKTQGLYQGACSEYSAQPPIIIEDYNNTDVGNGRRLVKNYGNRIRYCHPWKSWLVWDRQRWKKDDVAEVTRMAKDTAIGIYQEGLQCDDHEKRKALFKHAIQSETSGRISAMIEMAASEISIPILPNQLDKDGWLFNVQNGTIDLKTGDIRPQIQTDLITKISPVVYDPKAECPQWETFLNTIFEGDQELIAYLQKYTGYCLTGDTSEEIVLLGYGTGQNGKSKFREALAYIMGDYATSIPMESLLDKKGGSSASNDIAKLKGARFVHTSEQEKGRRLAESKLKDMTGRDTITARYLYQEYFDFKPEFKLFMAANHKPVVHGGDKGIWRRLKLIPFVVTIPEDKKDKDLDKKLQKEASGILNWLIEGCLNWQKEGLKEPEKVKIATEEYKEDMDIIGEFLSSCCDKVTDGKVLNKHIFLIYQAWCNIQNSKPLSHIAFPTEMEERGFKRVKFDNQRAYDGLRLKNDIILEIAQTETASDNAIIDGLTVMTDFLRNYLNIFSRRDLSGKPLNRKIEVKNKPLDVVTVMQLILSIYDGPNRMPGNGWDIVTDQVMLEYDLNMATATEYISAARKKLMW